MKKIKWLLAFYSFTFLLNCISYPLPDAKLKSKQVCGLPACKPGNIGLILHFTKEPYSPDLMSTTTLEDVATSVVGHAFPDGDLRGAKALSCSKSINNPFSRNEIRNFINPTGKNIDYTRKELLKIDIEAAVQGNIDEIKKLNPAISNFAPIEAKLKAAYSKVSNKELTVQAKYSEWGLSNQAIETLIKNQGFFECREFLKENNYRIITAVGIVNYDITLAAKSIDQISSELNAEMTQYGITADIGSSFKKEVTQSLSSSTKGGFQIVVWRSLATNDLKLN